MDGARAAEIQAVLDDRVRRHGSGYLVTADTVLTAAHVVRGASVVRYRFATDPPHAWKADLGNLVVIPDADLALLTIPVRHAYVGSPARFGRIGARGATIECCAVGFPLWKLRDDLSRPLPDGTYAQFRDSCHIVGITRDLSNLREGSLEITIPSPPPVPDSPPGASPWEGMSGAPVFAAGRFIGVITKNYRMEGTGRLTATRVDRWYEVMTSGQIAEVSSRLGLPEQVSQLPSVVPPSQAELILGSYAEKIRSLAPPELFGRERELADLAEFCCGSHQYLWVQGPPWSGKTALSASFAKVPPSDMQVASFFVTGRSADGSDSTALTNALIDQLAALTGDSVPPTAERHGLLLSLLSKAAALLREEHQRLLLIVDGLDEDQGMRSLASNLPSIASLLPQRLPAGVRVIVTSREHPPLPDDVPGDHPLRRCRRYALQASPHARQIEVMAKREMRRHLGDDGSREIMGLIAAAGGGLTSAELGEIVNPRRSAEEIADQLNNNFARSLARRQRDDTGEQMYAFAHDTLRTAAEGRLGEHLADYRNRIHAWSAGYRAAGWPENTPGYLLRPYGQMLGASADRENIATIAQDPARHALLLLRTKSEAAGLAEITVAQQLIVAQTAPDLTALAVLAAERDRLGSQTDAIPVTLPAVWARIGYASHAQDLARSIPHPEHRACALANIAAAIAGINPEHAVQMAREAEQVAREIGPVCSWGSALVGVARGFGAFDPATACQLAREAVQTVGTIGRHAIGLLERPETVLGDAAQMLAELHLWDPAAEIIQTMTLRGWEKPLGRLCVELANAGLPERAEHTARSLLDREWHKAEVLAGLALALAATDAGRATRLVAEAEDAIGRTDTFTGIETLATIVEVLAALGSDRTGPVALEAERAALANNTGKWGSQHLLAAAVRALAAAGMWDRAQRLAGLITTEWDRTQALAGLAVALARAQRWAEAESIARAKPGDYRLRSELAVLLAQAGKWDAAERTARSITWATERARVLSEIAGIMASTDQQRAVRLAGAAEDTARTAPRSREQVLTEFRAALRSAGLWKLAEQAARAARTEELRIRELASVAVSVAATDRDHASRLAEEATRRAFNLPAGRSRAGGLLDVGYAMAYALNHTSWADFADAIEQDIRALPEYEQGRKFQSLTYLLCDAGELDRAEQVARILLASGNQAGIYVSDRHWALYHVMEALADAGMWDRAESIARTDLRWDFKVRHLVRKMASARLWDRAEALASTLPELDRREALRDLAEELAKAGEWDRAEDTAHRTRPPWAPRSTRHPWFGTWSAGVRDDQWERDDHDGRHEAAALEVLSESLAAAGMRDRAERVARTITLQGARARALAIIARSAADSDQQHATALAHEAEQVARSPRRAWLRAEAIARSAADSDQQHATALAHEAEQVAEIPHHAWHRAETIADVAGIVAAVDRDRAARLAEEAIRAVEKLQGYKWAFVRMSRVLASGKLWEQAEIAANAIADPVQRAEVLSSAVRSLAADAQWHEAERVARTITSNWVASRAFTEIAKALLARSSPHETRADYNTNVRLWRVLGSALVGDGWTYALPALAEASPEAVTAVYDRLNHCAIG